MIYQLSLSSTKTVSTYKRVTILTLLSTFGGLMYTLRNVGNGINKTPSTFNIENTLMRKLYSVAKSDDDMFVRKNF